MRLKEQDLDPLVRGTDLRIGIRNKISWIRNTGSNEYGTFQVSHTFKVFSYKFLAVTSQFPDT